MADASEDLELKPSQRQRRAMVNNAGQRAQSPVPGPSVPSREESRPAVLAPGQRGPGIAHPEFVVKHGVELAIERGAEGPVVHHGKVPGVDPVLLQAELLADGLVELGAGKRIGDRHADVVRPAIPNELERCRNVPASLTRVAELQEESDPNPGSMQSAAGLHRLLDAGSLVHGIEDRLGARLGADPDHLGAGTPQGIDRVTPEKQVHATEALKRGLHRLSLDAIREALDPTRLEAEDIVDEPNVIGAVGLLEPSDLVRRRY